MTKLFARFAAFVSVVAGVSAIAQPAHAILELRGGYVSQQVGASDINEKAPSAPALKAMTGYNADAILHIPFFPFGFGVRYEDLTDKKSSGTNSIDVKYKRVSVILNHRFIDTIGYFGLIGTVGVTNDFQYNYTSTGGSINAKAKGLSGTAGLEGGVKLGFFLVGAEAGYLYAPLGNLKDSSGNTYYTTPGNQTISAKLDGVYVRGTVGFSF